MLAPGIAKNNGAFSVFVKEIIVDALLLHQTADEIEIRFPVLHAVGPGPITAGKPILDVAEPKIVEYLLDNVRHRFFLENTAIGCSGQKPQPGHHRCPVLGKLDAG